MRIDLTLVLAIVFAFPTVSYACSSDFACGYGNKCVKPAGSIGFTGTCVVPVNEYGLRDYNASSSYGNVGPTEVAGCSFNTDCNIGEKCLKKSGKLEGICVRK